MLELSDWARRHRITPAALAELRLLIEQPPTLVAAPYEMSEAGVQGRVRLEARATHGTALWRNNVGVLDDRMGRPVRFGLANDSAAVNKRFKSSDLIGITPVRIRYTDVGRILGAFTAVEVKHGSWDWSGTPRENAQQRFLDLVRMYGGLSCFARAPEDFDERVRCYLQR